MKYFSVAILASVIAFVACDYDYNEIHVDYSSSLNAGVLKDDDGCSIRLESIGDMDFFYAHDGCLEGIGDVDVNMSRFIVSTVDYYNGPQGREKTKREDKYTFTHNGWVSEIYSNGSIDAPGYMEHSNSTTSVSYNYNGQLSTMHTYTSLSGFDNGESFICHKTSDVEAIYFAQRISAVKCVVDAIYNGQRTISQYNYHFRYEDAHDNYFRQFTPSMAEAYFANEFDQYMMCLGFYGRGPSKIPTSIIYEFITEVDGVEEVEEGEYFCDYMFFRNEAIAAADGEYFRYSLPGGEMLGMANESSSLSHLKSFSPERKALAPFMRLTNKTAR